MVDFVVWERILVWTFPAGGGAVDHSKGTFLCSSSGFWAFGQWIGNPHLFWIIESLVTVTANFDGGTHPLFVKFTPNMYNDSDWIYEIHGSGVDGYIYGNIQRLSEDNLHIRYQSALNGDDDLSQQAVVTDPNDFCSGSPVVYNDPELCQPPTSDPGPPPMPDEGD